MVVTSKHSVLTATLCLAVIALCGYFGATQSIRGDFLNSYPFLYTDSFDWYYEGGVAAEVLRGNALGDLPRLRDPLPVFLFAFDHLAGANGRLILFLNAVAFVATGWFLLRSLRLLVPTASAGLATVMFATLAFHRFYLYPLGDPFGVLFSMMLFWQFSHWLFCEKWALSSRLAFVAVLVAGTMCRHYCFIPAIAMGVSTWMFRRERLREYAWTFALAVGVSVALSALWRLIPHGVVSPTFSLIAFNFSQSDFYLPLWGFLAIPLLPVLGVSAFGPRRDSSDPMRTMIGALALSVAAYATLSFFYQWRDTRFTFIYLPQILLLALLIIHRVSSESARRGALFASAALSVVVAFGRYDGIGGTSWMGWNMTNFWAFSPRAKSTADRFDTRRACPQSPFELCAKVDPRTAGGTDYRQRVLANYVQFVLETKARR